MLTSSNFFDSNRRKTRAEPLASCVMCQVFNYILHDGTISPRWAQSLVVIIGSVRVPRIHPSVRVWCPKKTLDPSEPNGRVKRKGSEARGACCARCLLRGACVLCLIGTRFLTLSNTAGSTLALPSFLRMASTSATSVVHISKSTPQPNFGNLLIIVSPKSS